MPPDLASSIWDLPSSRQWVRRACQDISEGISLLILFPQKTDLPGFIQNLRQCLEGEHFSTIRQIDLRYAQGNTPFDILQQLINGTHDYVYLEQMVNDPSLPDVILITHFEESSTDLQQEWVCGLRRWAEACRTGGSNHVLVIPTRSSCINTEKLLPSDVRLKYRFWMGIPSALETRLICRQFDEETAAEAYWREYLLASIGGSDLHLCEKLWDDIFLPFDDLFNNLLNYAKEFDIERETVDRLLTGWRPKPPGLDSYNSLLNNTNSPISFGLAVYTEEYGEEIHSAILAMLNKKEEINHRIWRAQASLILPLIDDVRRRICEYLSNQCRSGWDGQGINWQSGPLEMGSLQKYFSGLPQTAWEKRQWGSGVYQTLQIRNFLSHYKPISFAAYYELWNLSASVHKTLYH
jgi:hypothetical protein